MSASWGERIWWEERAEPDRRRSAVMTKYRIRVGDPRDPDYSAEGETCAVLRAGARELKITGPYVIQGDTREHGWIQVEAGRL